MHSHGHHHAHAPDHSRVFVIGILLNAGFVAAEIAYGLQADSLSLLADAGHNASDVLGLCLAAGAAFLARRRASQRFTYGLQSASILAGLANALLLVLAVGGIGWEAIQRLGAPPSPVAWTIIIVAAIGAAVNGVTAWLLSGHDAHDLNMRAAFWHMAADAAISLGVAVSGILMLYTGWLWLDPAVSLAIAAVIAAGSWRLLRRSAALALQAVPEGVDPAAVRDYLARLEGVSEVHDLHVWAMSTTGAALSAHLVMPGGHPGDAFLRQAADALAARFRIGHATIQIEIGDGGRCHLGCGE